MRRRYARRSRRRSRISRRWPRAQDRAGPTRVGPFGLLQPIADGAKFLLKEELIPKHVDKLFYLLAPAIAISTSTLAIAVVPFGDTPTPPQHPWAQTKQQED